MTSVASTEPTAVPDRNSVMRVIQDILNKMSGTTTPIDADTRIDRYFREVCGADSLEYLEFSFTLEEVIGIRITDDDWKFVSGSSLCNSIDEWEVKYAPLATFGRLAELIAQRASLGIVRPLTILGSTSLAAGAFRQIEAFIRQLEPKGASFSPSTPILDRLKGDSLRRVWVRCRIMSSNRVPPLIEAVTTKTFAAVFDELVGAFLAIVAYGVLVWQFWRLLQDWLANTFLVPLFSFSLPIVVLCLIPRVISGIERYLRRREFELPKDIRTFRDLAELIAGDRGGWCAKCGYDLTGLTEDRCPECGTSTHEPITPPKATRHE